MKTLRQKLIRLAYTTPEIRGDVLRLLASTDGVNLLFSDAHIDTMLDEYKVDPTGKCRRRIKVIDLVLDTRFDRDFVSDAGHLEKILISGFNSECEALAHRERCQIKKCWLESLDLDDVEFGTYRAPALDKLTVKGHCSVAVEGTRNTEKVLERLPFTAVFVPSRDFRSAYDALE